MLFIYGPIIRFLKYLLFKKKVEILEKSKMIVPYVVLCFNNSKFMDSLFKLANQVELKSLSVSSVFLKKQLFFFKNFFKKTFFVSLLFKFFKQIGFLKVPSSFYWRNEKKIQLFTAFKKFNLNFFGKLLGRFNNKKLFLFLISKFKFLEIEDDFLLAKDRLFLLYMKLRKFLSVYWRLKFKFFLNTYIWKTRDKVFIFLVRHWNFIGKIYVRRSSTNSWLLWLIYSVKFCFLYFFFIFG